MPAALDIDREAVKTLAVAVGVREAARQMNLPEATVQAWSAREEWFKSIENAKAIAAERKGVQPIATKPSEALANILADDNRETKLSLSRGVRRAAKYVETLAEPMLLTGADKVHSLVKSASTLHGWEEKQQGGFTLQVLSISGNTGIKISRE